MKNVHPLGFWPSGMRQQPPRGHKVESHEGQAFQTFGPLEVCWSLTSKSQVEMRASWLRHPVIKHTR